MDDIRPLVDQWLSLDRDDETRHEILQLVDKQDHIELNQRLRTRIAFGTAGLRSSMKAGFAHMNSLNVLTTSIGLARYIKSIKGSTDQESLSVVIGYDGRHRSRKFARQAAAAFLQSGFKVFWFDRLVHTPLVPFSVTKYKACAGIMITASHNPKNDNGYKVYWSNGSQIIPPHDAGIAKAIEGVTDIVGWHDTLIDQDGALIEHIFQDASRSYFTSITKAVGQPADTRSTLPFVYTPMHGVGLPFVQEVVQALGIGSELMHIVALQAQPDPEFPTVSFPNPEERGALNLAIEEADKHDIRLIIANDPDADRFSAAERRVSGEYQQFTGNQLGILFAAHILEVLRARGRDITQIAMLASTVSSRMLARMAEVEGFAFYETLTGFKWLGNVAQDLIQQGKHMPVFAFEEAIGYMFPDVVWDKDGVAAVAVFLVACRRWRDQGLSPFEKLQQLYERYGYFEDANTYVVSPSPTVTKGVFDDIRKLGASSRSDGQTYPERVGDRQILRWRDLTVGYDSGTINHRPTLPVDASAQMITCELEGDVVFTVRGSGTEPKIKFYIEARASSSMEATQRAQQVMQDLMVEWFKPSYGLRLAGS